MAKLLVSAGPLFEDISLIIFDKDGTLIDIHTYWTSMIRFRARKLIEWADQASERDALELELVRTMGIDFETGRMKPDGPVGIKPRAFILGLVAQVLERAGIEKKEPEIEAVFKEVDEQTQRDLRPLIKLLPGVKEFLVSCREAGIQCAIATTDLTSRAKLAVDIAGIGDFFPIVVGGDQVKRAKPAPDLGMAILEQAGQSAKHAVVIGDHQVDIDMAASCGMPGIGVLTGLGRRADFRNCPIISQLDELQARRFD